MITQGQFCSEQAEAAMFSVEHWQLDQNSCLPNDNVLRDIAAVLTAAEVGVPQDLGWGGLGVLIRLSPDGPRAGGVAWDGPARLCLALCRSFGAAAWP